MASNDSGSGTSTKKRETSSAASKAQKSGTSSPFSSRTQKDDILALIARLNTEISGMASTLKTLKSKVDSM